MNSQLLNFYVIFTLVCWGVWGILDKKALQTSNYAGVLFRLFAVSTLEAPLFYAFMAATQPHIHFATQLWWWSFLAAVARAVSFAAYLVAMSITDASVVLGVTAAYPVLTQILAASWLHETLVVNRLLGAFAITLGVVGIGSSPIESARQNAARHKLTLWLCIFIATVGWGVWGVFDKIAVGFGTPYEVWLTECCWEIVFVIAAFAAIGVLHLELEMGDERSWLYVILSAACLGFGKLTYLLALNMTSVSYVITITACYPLLMYLLAVVFLKEKFNGLRFAGIMLVVAGGIAVQLTQIV